MKLICTAVIIIAVALAFTVSLDDRTAGAQTDCTRTSIGAGSVVDAWVDGCYSPNRPLEPDGPGNGNYYARYYDFVVLLESEVTITLESAHDTYLYLLTGAGRDGSVLAKNDDIDYAGGNFNSHIVATLQPGSYSIEATTYNKAVPGVTGEFTLTVNGSSIASPTPTPAPTITPIVPTPTVSPTLVPTPIVGECVQSISANGSASGSWTRDCISSKRPLAADKPKIGDYYARYYTFSLSAHSSATITLNSSSDPYLYLLSGSGKNGTVLRSNDDISTAAGDYNSRIAATLQAGDYTIEATTFAPAVTGDFTLGLNVRVAPTPPPTDTDRAALVALYNATNGDNWFLNTNWLTDAPLGEWYGVETNSDGRVIELVITDIGMEGQIPPEIGNLTELRFLRLGGNKLMTGPIPPELGNLRQLRYLWLSFERFTGEIPPELGNLSELQELILSGNDLSGTIPAQLGGLSNLEYLDIGDNKLTGDIPPELGNLSKLRQFAFGHNRLSGEIPSTLGDLENLRHLHIAHNRLSGTIPPELGNLSNLQVLRLNDNDLSGAIPAELGDLSNLEHLNLGYNQLSGAIPSDLGSLINLKTLYLGGGNNRLGGEIPSELGKLSNLQMLWLGFNKLTGPIPAELGNLSNLQVLRLNDNDLSGAIPAELGSLSNLETLDIGHNEFTEGIPPELGRLSNLKFMYLGTNELTGGIPPELGNLASLERLTLGWNRLTGEIPSELSALVNLTLLDFGDNHLTGSIPSELGSLVRLEELYLGANELTGEIPSELGNLVNLTRLYIYDNELSGELPTSLTRLTKLVDFRFVGNVGLCAQDDANIQTWLQSIDNVEGLNCADLYGWSHRPIFDGGIDLGVTFIERLPRYERYKLAYFHDGECPYPHDEFLGAVVCPEQDGLQRWPNAGETVELKAHVWNFGDTASGAFGYRWLYDGTVISSGRHGGLASGEHAEMPLSISWPSSGANPAVAFVIDPDNEIDELLENNNTLVDWIKGYTLGFHFTPNAYVSLTLSNEPGETIQSAEHWVHQHIYLLNSMLVDAGLEDRVRAELFLISEDRQLWAHHPLRYYLDGWWAIRDNDGFYTPGGYRDRPEIDWGLLHELLHQLGVIDLYRISPGADRVLLPDANRPGMKAGCGMDYWHDDMTCYRFPGNNNDIMATGSLWVGAHTAGGLRSNTGHRRGFYGEYLYDTPQTTSVRVLDSDGSPTPDVSLRFYQYELQPEGHILDATPEFTLTTDASGVATLPNRGITGIVTATGHQLKPNPFGHIDVVGTNGLFIIEMEGTACTNYEWLTIVDLNLAYWSGQTGSAIFDRTLRCPPPSGSGSPSGIPADAGIEHLPPPYSPYTHAPQTDTRSTPTR